MRRFTLALFSLAFAAQSHAATLFTQTNLVTNDQSITPATIADPNLVNPWGISMSPTGPFWVSDNGSHLATLYSVDPNTQTPAKFGLEVTIPDAGTVTGQVNTTGAAPGSFNGDTTLFVSRDGTISGWRGALGTSTERFQVPSTDNDYTGAALVTTGGHSYLLSANFHTGGIDVLKGDPGAPNLTGQFTDPNLPAGYAPFNIQLLDGKIYITYGDTAGLVGAGRGIVNAFDTNGNLLARVASNSGPLNAPWGLAIAPSSFGELAGMLLVGNNGDGRINAFDLSTNTFVAQLNDTNNLPLSIPGLWALTPGNGASAGSTDALYFSSGPNNQSAGLLGLLTPTSSSPSTPAVPLPTASLMSLATLLPLALKRRHRPY